MCGRALFCEFGDKIQLSVKILSTEYICTKQSQHVMIIAETALFTLIWS